ncbi:hypothetical protein [Kitasatospora camelliae]|uniref:Acetoacetate decarboxylase n=1 Tax=Kitasatospora camelliae TaxID=3156397 RepID=A0AAU8JSL3_9ACTN
MTPAANPHPDADRPDADRPDVPPVPAPYLLPFHYGALHHLGVDFLVDPEPVHKVLAERHPGLTAAEFDGRACVSVNFQLYFAQYPNGGGVTQEVEVNIVARPAAATGLPRFGYAEYARGFDQSKLLGIARIHVLCDNPLAIDAGTRLYAEPKYPGWFETVMPSLNGPAHRDAWSVTCRAAGLGPDGGIERREGVLFTLDADLAGLRAEPVVSAPVTGYGTDPSGRLLAGPMNVHHPYRLHLLDGAGDHRVRLEVADGTAPVGRHLTDLLGRTPPAGVWTYQSASVAAHHRAYYVPTRG